MIQFWIVLKMFSISYVPAPAKRICQQEDQLQGNQFHAASHHELLHALPKMLMCGKVSYKNFVELTAPPLF